MIKFLLGSIFCLSLLTETSDAQEYHSRWIYFSEFSPSFPTDKEKILKNPYQNQSLEWRNGLGMRVFGEMFVGFNVSFRSYQQKETRTYTNNESSALSRTYNYTLENKLFGMGPLVTKFFEINPKFYLTASVIANLEQGRGKQNIFKETGCPTCLTTTANHSLLGTPIEIVNKEFKELILSTNAEVGLVYLIKQSFAVNANLMLFRYERNRSSSGKTFVDSALDPKIYREVNVSNRGVSNLLERPIIHLGIVIPLGIWESRY